MSEHCYTAECVFALLVAGASLAGVGCAGDAEAEVGAEVIATAATASPVAAAGSTTASAPEAAARPGASGVVDPGVRGGAPGAGGPLPGLTPYEAALWNEGRFRTTEDEATCDTCSDIPPGTPIPAGSPPDTINSAGLGAR